MSRPIGAIRSLQPDDVDCAEPQHTPPAEHALRRAVDLATVDLLRGAAAAQVQIGELGAQIAGLRQETRDGLHQLHQSAAQTDARLAQLVALSERANELRAMELEEARETRRAREEAARWYRSLVTPQAALIALSIIGAMLGVGHLLPRPVAP